MAALLNTAEAGRITRLQRYVEAACLVPGDDAITNAKDVKALVMAIRKFAEAGARDEAALQCQRLVDTLAGTAWHTQVQERVDYLLRLWDREPSS